MTLDERFEHVVVIGAAGKMGSGISLLAAQEMARLKAKPENKEKHYDLCLIDVSKEGLKGLLKYIHTQTERRAQKKPETLLPFYEGREDIKTNEQAAVAFVKDTLSVIQTSTDIKQAQNAHLVFEVVPETENLKLNTFKQLKTACPESAFFLSNTSSIPIRFLDTEAALDGRIIGFHFYNPPAIQKLVELIAAPNTRNELVALSNEIGERFNKIMVPSNDIAGFIGNGHFIRDGLHGLGQVTELQERMSMAEAVYAINLVCVKGLLRPMGIFQLIDYVGLDVFSFIMKVVTKHSEDAVFQDDLIDRMVEKKVLGGQRSDGSQKDGFFQYNNGRPAGVYSLKKGVYISIEDSGLAGKMAQTLGEIAQEEITWKALLRDTNRDAKLSAHFARLAGMDTLGASLSIRYLEASRGIGQRLVNEGVAASAKDVNAVLVHGFHHLYGPINTYAT